MRRFDFKPNFRLKLLLALLGTIAPVLIVTLLIVRREANQQVEHVVQSTTRRAGEAFDRVERLRQQQLQQLGWRFANSNRWGAALQQALEGDTAFLIDQTRYELEIAGFPHALAAFASLSGDALAGVVHANRLADAPAAIPGAAIDRLFAGDSAVFGYHIVNRELYSVHPTFLQLVTQPVGILLLGFAVDNETANSLGGALGADVCFFAAEHCIAASLPSGSTELERLARASEPGEVQRVTAAGKPYAVVKEPLPGAAAANTFIVLRIPLESIIGPFATIQRAIRIIGVVMLLLAIGVALLLSRGLARPIGELVAATARVAGGDYETSVSVRSRDELGTLANAFNEMTYGLLLKERYKGVLDKVVSRDVADEMLKGEIKLGGETREVTTLFADMRGFTPLTETMEPQSVISLLNAVMERAEEAVVTEGGVVDKYVGDEIMALFGAPISRGDDALRALRAAMRMQKAVAAFNELRKQRGETEISLGIGINTGQVVAGNMGSPRRLNYTVLGGPVNLAARLCSEARGGQILISGSTLERVRGQVQTQALGTRDIKGFSSPIKVYELTRVDVFDAGSLVTSTTSTLLALLLCCAPLAAQQLQPSARFDVNAFVPESSAPWLIPETDPFLAARASLFVDAFAGDHLYGMVELRVDRGEAPTDRGVDARIEQAFLRVTPSTRVDANLQLGRFVSPFGNYPQRHHSAADPFIRPPLNYDYRTLVSASLIPGGNDGFIDWKDDPDFFRPAGAPAVWAAPYQLGAMVFGSVRSVSFRAAAMNSAPSSEPSEWNADADQLERLSFVGHAAVQVSPELRLGLSFNRGCYLSEAAETNLSPGEQLQDYDQQLLGVEVTATRGFVELRAELLHDTWEVPRVQDDAVDVSYYVEGKFKLKPGLYTALRFGEMRFNELSRTAGGMDQWDYDVRRWQIAAGYRFTENVEIRSELMLNRTDGPTDPRDNLFALQLSWSLGR